MINLTEDQNHAFEKIQNFFSDEENPAIVIYGAAGTGKCLGLDTSILMYDGSTKMVQDVKKNDVLMGDDSTPRNVLNISSGADMLYQVSNEFSDDFVVNKNHILTLQVSQIKIGNILMGGNKHGDIINYHDTIVEPFLIDISVSKCIEKMNEPIWNQIYQSVYACLNFPVVECKNHPYLIGLWLGNGDRLLFNEGIPKNYLFNCKYVRLQLLAGIIDSNGLFIESKCVITHDKKIFSDLVFLISSLGYRINITNYSSDDKPFTLQFIGNFNQIPSKSKTSIRTTKSTSSPFKLKKIGIGNYYGFQLDGNGRFVLGNFLITHNTTLTNYIADYISEKLKLHTVAVAPTHKARRVLSKSLNKDRFVPIPSLTVASILGKVRDHTYIGTHHYVSGAKKMDKYDCFILDEVSMVTDDDLDKILDYICDNDKKIILIGDKFQIPAPAQKKIKKDGICYKSDSSAFDIVNSIELKQIVRQVSESPIIKIANYVKDHLFTDFNYNDILHGTGINSEEICIDRDDLYDHFKSNYINSRIIAYTNIAVYEHNYKIRQKLGFTLLKKGEILTGYLNVGFPTPVIENGIDYQVIKNISVKSHKIGKYILSGNIVDLVDINDYTRISNGLFFIDVQHKSNQLFMDELIKRAEKVNKRYSTKEEYKKYYALKNKAVFMDNIYKFANNIMTETSFKLSHPLLFTKITDVINILTKSIIISKLSTQITDLYGDIIEIRISDNKTFCDTEVFADQFMMIEKDIFFGYAITAHKSQGSTYKNVYVDDADFQKITNRWNYRFQAEECRCKEKNQLKYVAYTRASKNLYIIT